jgi:hypothetical protein
MFDHQGLNSIRLVLAILCAAHLLREFLGTRRIRRIKEGSV